MFPAGTVLLGDIPRSIGIQNGSVRRLYRKGNIGSAGIRVSQQVHDPGRKFISGVGAKTCYGVFIEKIGNREACIHNHHITIPGMVCSGPPGRWGVGAAFNGIESVVREIGSSPCITGDIAS